MPNESFGDASIIERIDNITKEKSIVKVRTTTLDNLLNELNIDKVDIIKMDVGAEPIVFEGMRQTIANNKDIQIIIEYSPFLYENPRALLNIFF